ncbi:MAG: dihydropteroate synthase [Ktedonobacterales bacterium]
MAPTYSPTSWDGHTLTWGVATHVMGILNITPDSFSLDGIAFADASREEIVRTAVERARDMARDGATLIDVGGESTRPSMERTEPLPEHIERERVVPVIEALASDLPPHVLLSIDTYKARVAAAALDAGACIVNDVWGLRADQEMAALVAERGTPVVLMSNLRGQTRREPVSDVTRQLSACVETALAAGIAWDKIILDPGFGFGLVGAENLRVMGRLSELRALGRPLLVGTSRKAHIGLVMGTPVNDRVEGTAATVALCIAGGADIVRVHDVRQMTRVARMADAVVRGLTPERSGA